MTPEDTALRNSLVTVLDTFDVAYEETQRNGEPVLTFRVGPGTQHFAYRADQPQANAVIRKLANLLLSAGLQPKKAANSYTDVEPGVVMTPNSQRMFKVMAGKERRPSTPPLTPFPEFAEQPDLEPPRTTSLSIALAQCARPREEVHIPAPTEELPHWRQSVEQSGMPPSPEPVEASEPSLAPAEPIAVESPAPIEAAQTGLLVYQPKPEYVPAEVYVVRAVQDLLISNGDFIVIPVHRPDLLQVLTQDELQARYAPAMFVPPSVDRRTTIHTNVAPQVVPVAKQAVPATEAPPTVEALEAVVTAPEPPVVMPPDVPETPPAPVQNSIKQHTNGHATDEAEVKDEATPVKVFKAINTAPPPKTEAPSPPKQQLTRMPAQIGRIILGIRQAMNESHSTEVTAGEAGQWMPEGDRKQIGARLPAAEYAGWVKRRRVGSRSFMYSVTPKGARLAESTATEHYLECGLAVPPFIKQTNERA